MFKKEVIWRYILSEALEKKVFIFRQKEIAHFLGISTSTVFNALKIPRKLGAIEVTGRNFRLRDLEKLLLFWATHRNLEKDLIYSTFVPLPVREIEGLMPPNVIFGFFSAYRLAYNETPADYSVVYIYSDDLKEIKKRFPDKKGNKNLFILKPDKWLCSFGKITPKVQTFVDLWNIPEWYSKDFLEGLKLKMNLNR